MTAVLISTPEQADCPDCSGQGVLYVVNHGRHAVEEYTETPCNACSGTGAVDAERVRECEDCQTTYWLELGGCAHRNLCSECGPLCKDCTREAREDYDADQAREVLRSLRSLRDPMSGRIDNWSQR